MSNEILDLDLTSIDTSFPVVRGGMYDLVVKESDVIRNKADNGDLWVLKLSPITYLDRVKAPLLVVQGVNDPRVPAGEAIQLHDALERRGVSSRLILFADAGHGTSKRADQVLWVGHVIKFLEENLKGVPKS